MSPGSGAIKLVRMTDSARIVAVSLTFVVAGLIKGVAGMGLPTVAMGLLGSLMPPANAAGLIVIPSLATNLWQAFSGRGQAVLLRRIWPFLLAIAVATWASGGLMIREGAGQDTVWLGIALLIYAAIGLRKFRLSVPRRFEAWLSPVVGATTGVVTGATGVFVVPSVPYLQALGFDKDDLVQVLGQSFTISTIALAAALASRGAFRITAAGASSLCTAPALVGMAIGQTIRARVAPAAFRRVFFIGLLILGAELLGRVFLR